MDQTNGMLNKGVFNTHTTNICSLILIYLTVPKKKRFSQIVQPQYMFKPHLRGAGKTVTFLLFLWL